MKRVTAIVAVSALTGAGLLAAAGSASAQITRGNNTVHVHATGSVAHVSRTHISAGRIRFVVDTRAAQGSEVAMFRVTPHSSLGRVRADLADEFGANPAKGTRKLTRDARFYGLADVVKGRPATVTERLSAGSYYVMDLSNGSSSSGPAMTRLRVTRPHHHHRSTAPYKPHRPVIKMTSSDRFVSPNSLPRHATVNVANVSDTLHFVDFTPVAKGTTDAQVQAYFNSGSQNPPSFFVNGPSAGVDVLSPRHAAQFSYNLPKGTYVLLCFVADDKTGMPHAVMGMHKVITLK